MSRLRVRAIGTSLVIVLSLTMVGASPAVASSNGLAGKSSQQIVSIALAAGIAKGSVHTDESGEFDASSYGTLHKDVTKSEGREVDSGTGAIGHGTVLVIKGIAYAMGDADFLYGPLTMTQAVTYAGKWIAFHKGDQGYNDFAYNETLVQHLVDVLPVAPYSRPKFTTLNGIKVVMIAGHERKSLTSAGLATDTAYFSASPPYLPVESDFDIAPTDPNGPYHTTLTFSRWGEKVPVSPPSNPIPASSIFTS
jgi:hypothetical protein